MSGEQPPKPEDLEEAIQTFVAAMEVFTSAVQQIAETITEVFVGAFEDAFRDNAYHPTGPVVRGTAIPIDDDAHLIEGPKTSE